MSYFILSCARSGSTSLADILNSAENGVCVTEPSPNLNWETREMMEGRLVDPMSVILDSIVRRVGESTVEVYGEKNVTYGPFIPYLTWLPDCKFVFLKRDGRDVVRSLMDWHERMFGTVYRECQEPGRLSARAIASASRLPVHKDTSDYSRPRPMKGTRLYDEWEGLSREEMCAYYWSYINDLYSSQLEMLPRVQWVEVDYTRPKADDILRVSEWLGLKGLTESVVQGVLDKKVNSLKERIGEEKAYPDWKNWDGGMRRRFDGIAESTMWFLEYYHADGANWRPEGYGKYWIEHGGSLDWYEWMYDGRMKMHKDLMDWVDSSGKGIKTVADIGCGLGVGYSEFFGSNHYTGIDLSPKNAQWCLENRHNVGHTYLCQDVIEKTPKTKFDLVFSMGTIDNSYDVDAFLEAMVEMSKGWVYLTCYRGWFPELEEHKYMWSEEHGCFYNDLSPRRIREKLEDLGCEDIVVEPVKTGNRDILYETRVVARV